MDNEITLKQLMELLSDFARESPTCRYSADGCQPHNWGVKGEKCPFERAKDLLDWQDKQHFRLVIEVHDRI